MWQVLAQSRCALGESPFWHPREQSLYWVDISGRAVLRTRGRIGGHDALVERWTLPSEPGCMAPARSGGLVIALRDGIYRAREWGGALRLMAPALHDARRLRFNDGKCDPLGRFWAGSVDESKAHADAALCCLRPTGGGAHVLHAVLEGATTANGLAFDAPTGTLYWTDTPTHSVRAWDWDAASNRLARPREYLRFAPKPPGWSSAQGAGYEGRPDGATLDAQGRYWTAMYEGAQVLGFERDGTPLAALALPAQCPTMPCFGGEDLCTLFVTTARHGRSDEELARLPDSGSVFHTRFDTPGRPVDFFDDA